MMTQLSELYDGDKANYREDVQHLRPLVRCPHPLTGVQYADGKFIRGVQYPTPEPKAVS